SFRRRPAAIEVALLRELSRHAFCAGGKTEGGRVPGIHSALSATCERAGEVAAIGTQAFSLCGQRACSPLNIEKQRTACPLAAQTKVYVPFVSASKRGSLRSGSHSHSIRNVPGV